MPCQCGPSIVTNVPLWWGMLIGEAMHGGGLEGGQGLHGKLVYFPLTFMSPKLP